MEIHTVSLCLLARNEEKYLPGILSDIVRQTYPHHLTELIFVNSCSEDSTLSIMAEFRNAHLSEYRDIQILTNPRKSQPSGWNVAIQAAAGDAIARIDAHCRIPPEYIARNMVNLQLGETVSGGIHHMICDGNSAWENTLLRAEKSLFGSSAGRNTEKTQKRYAKSLSLGVYRKSIFDTIGLFNEELLRTEDNELHFRIREAGHRLCLDPQIDSFRYCRSTLSAMLRQKYGNGYWVGYTLGVCPGCIGLHHLAPLCFVLLIFITTVFLLAGAPLPGLLLWLAYGLFALGFSVTGLWGSKVHLTDVMLPVLFLLMHLSYGIGTCAGLIGLLVKKT